MLDVPWKKNLVAIIVAEFVALIGLNFSNPFLPFYVQHVGDLSTRDTAFWAGLATGVSGIAMFFSAPVWGILADRYGRKPMVLRAQLGAGIVLALMGVAPNLFLVVVLRFALGLLAGTVAIGAVDRITGQVRPVDKIICIVDRNIPGRRSHGKAGTGNSDLSTNLRFH